MTNLRPGPVGGTSSASSGTVSSDAYLEFECTGAAARGSTNTNIMHFQSLVRSQDDDSIFTVTNTAAAGTYVQVSTAGFYDVTAVVQASGAVGVGVSAGVPNNTFDGGPGTKHRLGFLPGSSGYIPVQSGSVWVPENGYICVYASGTIASSADSYRFVIRKR